MVSTRVIPAFEGEAVTRLYIEDKGHLDFQEEEGIAFLIIVEVEPEYRNQGIATELLKAFLEYVNSEELAVDISGFLEDGEKYLQPLIKKLKPSYPNILWL